MNLFVGLRNCFGGGIFYTTCTAMYAHVNDRVASQPIAVVRIQTPGDMCILLEPGIIPIC